MRKLLSAVLAICAAVLCLSGCTTSGYSTFMSVENKTNRGFQMRYEKFDGTKQYRIRVEDGEELAVQVDIVTESGSLALTIAKGEEEPVYTGTELPTGSFTVNLKEPGTYTVTLTAGNHSGSYSFDWSGAVDC